MALQFDLFQPPPSAEAPAEAPQDDGGLNLFVRPPGFTAPSAPADQPRMPRPSPEAAPEQSPAAPVDDLNLFARPPSSPAAPAAPEPAINLFNRPPSAEAPSPPRAPARAPQPAPAAPPARGQHQQERADFEGDDLWDQFLTENYQGGRARVPHPDPRRRRRYPEVMFSTAMGYPEFRQQVGREFQMWKGQRRDDDPVGRRISDPAQLEVGDVLRPARGKEIKVSQVLDDGRIRYYRKREDGSWGDLAYSMGRSTFVERRFTLQSRGEQQRPQQQPATPVREAQVGEAVRSIDRLRVGDVIRRYEDSLRRRVVKIDGDQVVTEMLSREGNVIARNRHGIDFLQGHKFVELSDAAPAPQAEPQPQPAAPAPPGERPRAGIGETIENPRALRVGDRFRNEHLRGQNQYREVMEIRPNGDVMTRLMSNDGREITGPVPFAQALIEQHGPYKRFAGPGQVISSPNEIDFGTYLRKGDAVFRVLWRTPARVKVQRMHGARGIGRPTLLRKQDFEGGNYKVEDYDPTEHEGLQLDEMGQRIQNLGDLRSGDVIKTMYHLNPKWVRVEQVTSSEVKLQPLNERTGNPEGDPETLTSSEVEQWGHLARMPFEPVILRPPIQKPEGGLSPPGEGNLVPNIQSDRYAHVEFRADSATKNRIRELLGNRLPEGEDPLHAITDLAAGGGLARSLKKVSISFYGNTISFSAGGHGVIEVMDRSIIFDGNGNPDYIYNSHFRLHRGAPPKAGLRAFASQIASAKKYGFKSVQTTPAGRSPFRADQGEYVGYYVWPRFGYNASVPGHWWNRFPQEIKDAVHRINPRASDRTGSFDFNDLMMAGKPAQDWWKDNGSDDMRRMTFDLSDRSRSYEFLTDYVRKVAQKFEMGAEEFVQRSASKKGNDKKHYVEEPPAYDPETDAIARKIWDRMGDEVRKRNEKKRKSKKATQELVGFARDNAQFRQLLLKEIASEEF